MYDVEQHQAKIYRLRVSEAPLLLISFRRREVGRKLSATQIRPMKALPFPNTPLKLVAIFRRIFFYTRLHLHVGPNQIRHITQG